MNALVDLTGKRFGRWTVLKRLSGRYWKCRCDCGTETHVYNSSLISGVSTSCGCRRIEVSTELGRATKGGNGNRGATRKHGEAIERSAEYRVWLSMRWRCNPINKEKAPNYGGRGIKVCERWDVFENFLADMGRRPSKLHSLDRIDNNGNYEPSNCRWATKKEQVDNRRKFGRIERFNDDELVREMTRRGLPFSPAIDGYLSFST